MSQYTIIEPSVEFIPPDNYLEFLEICTRVCYKSESFIKEGSAEKLLNKVVKNYEHYSVTEHANAVFRINNYTHALKVEEAFIELSEYAPLIRKDMYRTSEIYRGMLMSGNVRMWMEFLEKRQFPSPLLIGMKIALHKKWPFFFPEYKTTSEFLDIEILDEDPRTNKDNLATCMMKRHMTLTVKFTGSRTFSHQLVRHRMFAFCIDGEAETILTCTGQKSSGGRYVYYKRRTIKELFEMKKTPHGRSRLKLVKINCLNEETGEVVQSKIKDIVYSGKKPCIEIKTKDGYSIRATKDHRFFTPEGWKRLEDILEDKLEVSTNGLDMPSIEWLREEYLIKNRQRKEIAKELGISDVWLGKYIAKHNLQKPKKLYPNRRPGHGNPGMHSIEGKRAISNRMKGKNNHRWRGGITREAVQLRKDAISPDLRKKIYSRDDTWIN